MINSKETYRKIIIILLSLVLIILPFMAACDAQSSPPQQTDTPHDTKILKIGGSLSLSGFGGMVGTVWSKGMKLAFDKINEDGGLNINGNTYMIDFIIEDNKGTPEGAATAATKLIHQDNVDIILHMENADLPAIHQVTSEAGVLLCLAYTAFSGKLGGSDVGVDVPLTIRLHPVDDEVVETPIKYLVENYPNVKTVALTNLELPGFEIVEPDAATKLEQNGLKQAGITAKYAPDQMDFYPIITKTLDSNPDAVYVLHALLNQFVVMTKTLREQGFDGPITFSTPYDIGLVSVAMPDLSDVFGAGVDMDAEDTPDSIQEVIELGRAEYGSEFVSDSLGGYDVASLLAQTIEIAQSTDPQTIQDVFETLSTPGDLISIYGPAHVGGLETLGVNRVIVRPIPMYRVVNSKGDYIGSFLSEVL